MLSIILRILGFFADLITIRKSLASDSTKLLGHVGFLFLHLPDGSPAPAHVMDPFTQEALAPDGNGMLALPLDRSGCLVSIRDRDTKREIRTAVLDLRPGHTMRIEVNGSRA